MKISDYIAEFLVQKGVNKVFGYIGGNNAHIMDSIDCCFGIEMVNGVHEQGSGFAAEGYARATNKLGVATATSGPGATNLVTPIGSCFMDSIPTLFITGQVNRYEYKYDEPVRQIGFQEMDIVSIIKPITKYAVFLDKIENVRYEFEKACYIAEEGRKGPVLIDIPIDLQYQQFEPDVMKSFYGSSEHLAFEKAQYTISDTILDEVATDINSSKRPLLLVGGGSRLSGVDVELLTFLNKTDMPVVVSLMGKDMVSSTYKYNLGFIGAYGIDYANQILKEADLVIILGARLDARQTTRDVEGFIGDAKVIHVDIDKYELNRRISADLAINADVYEFISKLNTKKLELNIKLWKEKVLEYKSKISIKNAPIESKIDNQIINMIASYLDDDDIICVDVGLHQMTVAQSLDLKGNQRVLFSGGAGSMGFALPIAIGATLGTGRRVIVISGDGGFQMNMQELEVIKRRNLPIKIFIINNASLHMVKLRQDTYLESNHVGSKKDYSVPSFKKVGEAYGINSHEANSIKDIYAIIEKSLSTDEAELIDIQISGEMTTVEPRLDFNRSFEDMRPYLERDELKKQMLT